MSAPETASREAIQAALAGIIDSQTRKDLVSLGYIRNIAYCDGVARVLLSVPQPAATEQAQRQWQQAVVEALMRLPGMRAVNVDFALRPPEHANLLPGVRNVLAVGAGKGGVGKSTVTVLLAVGLQRLGYRVGILDADVYGPSVPKLTGTEEAEPQMDAQTGRIIPPESGGVKILSMGYLVDRNQAVVWRGPMAQKYVREFLERGDWGALDYLIVDLPPGTGDIPLTLAQSIPLTGAVVVCTPQDVALLDALKALRMYQKLGVDVLGMVENMSYYICPHCGQREEIFAHGGARRAAQESDVPFLGEIPLNVRIREYGDAGQPGACFVRVEPAVLAALEGVVRSLVSAVEARGARPQPTLTITG
jgi:ATP-binding protein involved in chromosome partitioning